MTTTPPDARLGLRGRLILITLCGATFMTGLDYSVITVALPEIGRDLHFSGASALQWVVTACLLPTAALMPLFGRASDMLGRRRSFIVGVAAFTALSLLAGLAPSPGSLVAARAGQGVAAAMIGPTALALMTRRLPRGAAAHQGPGGQRRPALAGVRHRDDRRRPHHQRPELAVDHAHPVRHRRPGDARRDHRGP